MGTSRKKYYSKFKKIKNFEMKPGISPFVKAFAAFFFFFVMVAAKMLDFAAAFRSRDPT